MCNAGTILIIAGQQRDTVNHIRGVLFDLDGTLLRYERSPEEVLTLSFETVGIDPLFSIDDYYARFDEFAQQHDSMEELRSDCFTTLAVENGHTAQLGRDVARVFNSERDQTRVELQPSAREVIEQFHQKYELAVVTNGAQDAQQQKIDAVGLEQWIDTVVIAGNDIPPKPASEPFLSALDSLGVSSDTAVHIGDSLAADIGGATDVGLRTVWISSGSSQEYAPTYQVDSLADLSPPPWEKRSEPC